MSNSQMKYIVIGRTGTGKKTFLKDLKLHNVKVNRSYTTRRDADPDIYEIISEEQAAGIKDKLFVRNFEDSVYFTTRERFDACQIISLDPQGLKTACEENPNLAFRIINVRMADDDRLKAFISKIPTEEKITAEEDFIARCQNEEKEQTEFETAVTSAHSPFGLENIISMHALLNDGTESSSIFEFYQGIEAGLNAFERMYVIILDLITDERIDYTFSDDDSKNILIRYTIAGENGESIERYAPIAQYAETVLADRNGVGWLLSAWLHLKNVNCVFRSVDSVLNKFSGNSDITP